MSSKIEWTDNSDNVFVVPNAKKHGWHCEKISPGCANCYAESWNMQQRFNYGTGLEYARKNRPKGYFVKIELMEKWKTMRVPKVHFINSMTDTFLDLYLDEDIITLFEAMAVAKKQFFIVLTKRIDRVQKMDKKGLLNWRNNIMLMITAEDQERADDRIGKLILTKALWKGVSIEPMLEMINIEKWLKTAIIGGGAIPFSFLIRPKVIHWIIVGGESGKNARPVHPDWVRKIADDCHTYNVPFFFKQWGNYYPEKFKCEIHGNIPLQHYFKNQKHFFMGSESPRAFRVPINEDSDVTDLYYFQKVGKKKAGHLLDGEEYREYPEFIKRCWGWICVYCGDELDGEEKENPRKDWANDVMCDGSLNK